MSEKQSPLYLPAGSVRSILALSLTGALIYGFIIKIISAELFVPLVVAVVSYYFGQKKEQ